MRSIFLVLFMVMVSGLAFGQDIQSQIEYPIATTTQEIISASTTAQLLSPLAGRRFVQIINLSTESIKISTATSTYDSATWIPIFSNQDWCDILGQHVPVWYAADSPATGVAFQGR